jgi:hypothetical protein
MKRDIAGSAGLLALLALAVHTQYNAVPDVGVPGQSANGSQSKSKKARAATGTPDEPPEGPWIATQAFFNEPGHRPYEPSAGAVPVPVNKLLKALVAQEGLPDLQELRLLLGLPHDFQSYSTWSIIATVTDPRHTRLSLFFDRQIEAIERSLQAAGWEFASQWLPWMDRFDPAEGDIGERRRQRRLERKQEEFPGILVFRRVGGASSPHTALFVLLVPETPTSGASGPSFFGAMHLASVLSSKDHEIGLLAPTFSGSFSSLSQLITSWKAAAWPDARQVHTVVYGGSISNGGYAESFHRSTGLTFRGGIATSEDYTQVFRKVLDLYGVKPEHAAYLVEDESGFAEGFPAGQIPQYVFPRDIAHIRNAYKEESGTRGTSRSEVPSASIEFSIKDPNAGEDSIPLFSEGQTPLSQDAAVSAITEDLKRRRTRIVFIAATNSLDSLFLARLVRRDSPDTRILIGNPDILFVSAAVENHLMGTLFLSTYPMFFKGDEWLNPSSYATDHLTFPGPDFQGIFNVTQLLLRDIAPDGHGEARLRAYGQFECEATHPGLWLLSLTRKGFSAFDLIDESHDAHRDWFAPNSGLYRQLPQDEPPPFAWQVTAFLTSMAIGVGCFFLVGSNIFRLVSKPVWLTLTDSYRPRLLALLGGCLALSALAWVLGFPAWWAIAERAPWPASPKLIGTLTFLGFLAPIASMGGILWALRKQGTLSWRTMSNSAFHGAVYGGIAVGMFVVATSAWGYACLHERTRQTGLFFRLRALDLFSGSSPALPFAILCLMFLVFSLSYFRRYTFAGIGRPRLSLLKIDWPEMIKEHQAIQRHILAPVQLEPIDWWRRIAVCGFMVAASLVVLGGTSCLGAFEIPTYNLVLTISVSLVLFCLATGCYDLAILWAHFKRFLGLLELVPLKTALDRVSRDWPRQPIWAFHRSVSKEQLDRQMLTALHNRRALLRKRVEGAEIEASMHQPEEGGYNPGASMAARVIEEFNKFRDVSFRRTTSIDPQLAGLALRLAELHTYEVTSVNLAAQVLSKDLVPTWRTEINEDSPVEERDPTAGTPAKRFLRFSADFVTLQLCRYVVYLVEQTRRIAFQVSLGFLMLTAFLNSYNPQGPLVLARYLALLFLATSLIVYRVLAGMERNRILSQISRTNAGELNRDFWIQLIALGGLPFLGVLAHLFPSISQFLFSWVAPSVEAMR